MNEREMHLAMDAIARRMLGRGYAKPNAQISITSENKTATIYISGTLVGVYTPKFFHRDTAAEAMDAANDYLDSLPTDEEIIHKQAIEALEEAIVACNKAGMTQAGIGALKQLIAMLTDSNLPAPTLEA